jgi:hypothetical protein
MEECGLKADPPEVVEPVRDPSARRRCKSIAIAWGRYLFQRGHVGVLREQVGYVQRCGRVERAGLSVRFPVTRDRADELRGQTPEPEQVAANLGARRAPNSSSSASCSGLLPRALACSAIAKRRGARPGSAVRST